MIESPRTRTGDAGRSCSRPTAVWRWGALIGGSAVAIYGITRNSPLGVALAVGGGTVALLGVSQKQPSQQPTAWTTLIVNCSPQDAYRFWRDFENLPRFMNRLQTVTTLDDRRSRWIALGPMDRPITWDAEITEEREKEFRMKSWFSCQRGGWRRNHQLRRS